MSPDEERDYGDYVVARSRQLCEFAYLICGDWHSAQDAVQTALTKLYLSWSRLHSRDALEPYVRRIVLRAVLDERRLARFRRESSWAHPPDAPSRVDHAGAIADRLTVLEALRQMPPRQRAVVVLRYWEDQSVTEAAEVLGCSEGTIKSQAARGLAQLRTLLRDHVKS